MLLQATVKLDEGFSLFAHFKKHIPFTKETLQNTEFKHKLSQHYLIDSIFNKQK